MTCSGNGVQNTERLRCREKKFWGIPAGRVCHQAVTYRRNSGAGHRCGGFEQVVGAFVKKVSSLRPQQLGDGWQRRFVGHETGDKTTRRAFVAV